MAGKRIEVQLGINADVAAAKKSIKDLETSLSKLYQTQSQRGFEDFGINKAVESAQKLEQSLHRALNVDTGKLDLSKFSTSLKQAGTSLTELNTQFLQAGTAGQQVFLSLANSIAQAEVPLKKTSRLVQEFSRTLKNTVSYQLSASMFNAITGALHDAISYTKNLNGSLNEIRIVTGQSADQMAKFAQSANAAAKQLSTTTNNYAKASLIFYQQGLSDADVKKRTDAVIKMANVTKESADDVSSYMTAIWNNFDDGSKSLERYADVMTALGAATASSTKEIAAGLEKFASIGKTIGLSYEYATSAVATIVDKTRQSAETVGTGLRTIFSRLQGLSLGETLEDGVDLNKYSAALKTVGVNILDASGNMRDMDAILESLAGKWQNLSNAQKTALAQTVGGVRQYTTLISLMDNWDSMERNLNTANTSAGSLQKQQDIYAESWEAASERSKAALEGLYQTLLNDKGFITLINGLTGVTEAVTVLADALGGLPGILGMVGMISTKVFSQQMSAGLQNVATNLVVWNSQFKGLGFKKSIKKIGSGDTQSAAQRKTYMEIEKAQSEYSDQIGKTAKGSAAEYAAKSAWDLLDAKRQLLDAESKLSDTAKKNAQDQIILMGKQQEKLLELAQEKEKMAADDRTTAKRDTASILETSDDWTYSRHGKTQIRNNDQQLAFVTKGQFKNQAELNDYRNRIIQNDYRNEMADKMLSYTQQGGNDLDQLRAGMKDIFNIDASKMGLADIIKQLEDIQREANEAEKEIHEVESAATGETKTALKNMRKNAQDHSAAMASADYEKWQRTGVYDRTKAGFDKTLKGKETPDKAAQAGAKIAAGLQTAVQAAAALTAGISQAQSAIETFGDSGATAGEKIAAGVSVASGAMTAFASGGVMGLAAYAIGAVASGVQALTDKMDNKEENAAQVAEESAAKLQENYTRIRNEYEETMSTIESYDSASKSLDQLVTGTDEWKEALLDANEAALKLISNFNLIEGQDYTFGSNGEIVMTKSGDQKIADGKTQQLNDAIAAQNAADMAKAQANVKRMQAQKDVVVREDNGVDFNVIGTAAAGAAIGAAAGTFIPVIGNAIGALGGLIIGGLVGIVTGVGERLIQNGLDEAQKDKIDALTKIYEDADGLMTDEELRQLINKEFAGESDSFKSSIMDIVKATADANDQLEQTLNRAAANVVTSNEIYQSIMDEEVRQDLIGRGQQEYNEKYAENEAKYQKDLENESKRKNFAEEYLKSLGLTDATIKDGTINEDGSFTYTYLDENNQRQTAEATADMVSQYTISGQTSSQVNDQIGQWAEVFKQWRNGSEIERAMAAFGGQGLRTASKEEFDALLNSDYESYFAGLNSEQLAALGYDSAEAAIAAFESEIGGEYGLEAAWEKAISGIGDIDASLVSKMSLETAQSFTNSIEELSKGPMQNVGQILNDGLMRAFAEANVKEADKETLLAQIANIDWSDYDAFDQFVAIFEGMGYSIDEASEYWSEFTGNMRKAGLAIPDFTKLKNNLNSIAKITKDLKLGDIISEEDYQTLIDYNSAWKDFFVLQADGSRKFIGNADDMRKATEQMALDQKALLDNYKEVSDIEDVQNFNWFDTSGKGSSQSDFMAIYDANAALQEMLTTAGYTRDEIVKIFEAAANGDTTGLQLLFGFIQKAVDPSQLEQANIELEQMIASMAETVSELQALRDLGAENGGISDDTYQKSLIAMASGYEYCASAIEDYQKALASGDEEAISAAEDALEAAVIAEQAAEKYEQMYTNAFSGRASMTVADLKLLKETNEELYNSFLTMSDAEWLAASYEAYSEWLDTQLATYAVDSEAYRDLMLEKRALDEEYYNYIQKQQENLLEILDENYEKQINAVDSVVDILSELSSGEKVFSDLSFEELFELEKQLKEIGYTTEQVDELLKNLGKDEKKTDKESVLAAMRAEVDMLLSGIAATNAQKEMRYDGLTTTLTIDSVVLGDNVPQKGDQIYISATTDPIEVSAVGSETVEETGGEDGPGWKVKGDVKGPDDVDIKVGAIGTGKLDPSLTKFAQGAFASFNGSTGAMATFGVDLETTTADGDTQSAGRLYWNGSSLVFSSTPIVGNVAFGAQLAEGDDTTQFIYEGGKLTLNSQVVTAEGTIDVVGVISSGENTGELTYDADNGFGFVGDTPNGPEIFCTFKPSSDIESVLSYNEGVWTLTGMTESGIPIKLTYTNEGLPEILESLTQLSEDHPLVAEGKIDPRNGFSADEIFLYYEWVNLNPQTPIEELEGQTARVGVEYYDASDPSRSGGAISSITTVQNTLHSGDFTGVSNFPPRGPIEGPDLLQTSTGRQLMEELNWSPERMALLDPYKGQYLTPSSTSHAPIAGDTANYDNLFALMDTLKRANADMDDISAITQSWVADTQKTNEEIENMVATLVLLMEEGFFGEEGSSTYQMGAWLMHGLIEGWSGTDTSAFPSTCATILSSIGQELEVASPSKATIRMGKWLMEGLNIGWNSVEFDAGNIQGKILNAIAKELEKIDQIDIGNIPLTYNADGDDTNADTVADLEDTWLGDDLRKESSLLQDYDPRRVQLRYMEGYLMSRDGGIDENETPTLFNADGSMAIDGNNLSSSQQTILQQAFGANYTATTNAEGKIVIDVETEGVEDLVFDNWSQAYEHAVSSAFTEAKMPEWLSGNANGTPREGLDKVTDAIVSQAVKDYLAQNNMSDMTVQDAINQFGLDTVLEGVQGVIDQGYGELNNYSEKSWAKIKDSWIAGAQKVLSIENEAAKEYYDLWVATFEAIVEARKIIFEEGNLGLELDEKTIAQLATDAILNSSGTFDPTTWLNNLFNPEKNNITNYTLPAYQSGVLGTDAQFLKYNAAGFLSSNQNASEFGSAYQQHFTNQWMGHMTEEALAPYLLLLNTLQANNGDAEAARNAVLNDSRAAEYGIGAATYDKMMNDANLFKALGIIAQAGPGKAYGYNASSEEADALLDQWIGSNGDLSEILYQVFATTLGGQMGVEADYRQQLYRDGEARYNAEMDRISADQAIVQKAMQDGIESLTRTEKAELDRIMEEGNYSSLEDANVGLARSADAAAAGLDRLTAALGQGLTTDGNGNWFNPNAVTGRTRADTPTFDSISAAQEYAAQNGIDIGTWSQMINPETQQMTGLTSTSIQQNADGSYYLRSDVVPASSVITEGSPEWEGLAPEGTEYTDDAYLTAAQAAGFDNLTSQDTYIEEAEGRTIVGAKGESKNLMATEKEIIASEMIARGVTNWNELSEAEQEAKLQLDEYSDVAEEAEKRQRKYANQLKKMEKAYKKLAEEGDDLVKTANDEEASMADRSDAIDGLREIYEGILGPMEGVSNEFLKSAENMELAKKAAEGDEEAMNKLQVAYFDALTDLDLTSAANEELAKLAQTVAEYPFENLEIGATINDTEFLSKCEQLISSAGLTAEQASAALSSMGVDAKIIPHTETVPPTTKMEVVNGNYEYVDTSTDPPTKKSIPVSSSITTTDEGITYTWYTIEGATYNGKGVTGGGGGGTGAGRGSGRRGGGGGGGERRDPRRANHISKKDNIERYHEIDNTLDDLADTYERLNNEEDRAWGKNRIDAMKAQTNVIKEQIAATEEKIRQAKEWKDKDLSAALAAGWTFDANGNVNNYDEFLSSQIDKYNAAIDSYNGMSAEAQEELDEKYSNMTNKDGEYYSGYEDFLQQTLIDDPTEALEQYEETMELLEDLGMDYDDLLNEWHDNIIGQIQTKLDTTLEVTEAQLGYLEHKLSRIEDDAYSAAEAIGLMGQQMDIAQTQFNAHKSALDDLLKAYSPEGTVWSAEDLMNGNISSEDLVNAGMQSGDIELIQTIMEGMMDASEQMSEQMVNSIEHMANAFDEFNADMDRYISTVEHAQAITSTYRNIIDLTGRTMSGFNSTMLKSINDAIAAQSIAKLETNKTKYETIKTEYDEAKAAYEAAQQSYAEGGIDAAALKAAKDTYQAAQDNMNEAQEAFLSSWEEALQAAADAFKSNMEAAVRDIGEMMSGGLAGGLAELEDAFAKMNQQDQNYVDDYEKIYQLTKMTRDLTDKIDSTSNIRAQKELLKYQKELNGLLESDQEMSAYDLDYLQKKLDLKLAEIALDEAQNAKSQVTMRRDSEGNYNYVYTADENAVEKAESDYADRLYEMQKANDEYITGLSENMANLSSQMLSEIAAIDTTIYDTEEKYQAEVQRITEHYTAQMEYYNSEMNKVLGNNKDLYEKDWTNFSKYTGYKLSAEENYVTKWNQTVLSQVTGFETQEEFYQNFNEAVFGGDPTHPSGESLIGRLVTAYKTMRDQIAAANAAAGVETEDLATALLGNIEAATQEAEAAADDITEAATEIVTQITSIGDAVTNMVNNYSQAMATMEAETDAMLGVLLDFLTAYGEIGDLDIDPGVLAEIEARRRARQENPEGYDTGGYTGAWGSEGRLAYLHQKELVLNAEDTANMLASVGILRQIASVIDLNALASAGGFISLASAGVAGNQGTLQQEVHIEASFPGVTDKNQIEEAFTDLVNLAAQYANR